MFRKQAIPLRRVGTYNGNAFLALVREVCPTLHQIVSSNASTQRNRILNTSDACFTAEIDARRYVSDRCPAWISVSGL